MPSLKDLRNRIASVRATQKITKAMQMVAAAKLRRTQQAALAARPFVDRMEKVLANIARATVDPSQAPRLLAGTGATQRHLLVVCTADRGLCGPFNSTIVRLAREHAVKLLAEGKEVTFFSVGRKGYDQLRRLYERHIVETAELRGVRTLGYANAEKIADRVLELFAEGRFDVCTLFYSRFKSVISQIPTARQIIPAAFPDVPRASGPTADYEFEPSEAEILADLLPRYLTVQIFQALLENAASEQGARMTAMDAATRNAGEMIKKQTLKYNRTRQAIITKELIEIISGAEAL